MLLLLLPVLLLAENQPKAARCYVAAFSTYSLIEHNQGPLPLLRLLSLLLMLLAVLVVLPLLFVVQLMLSLVLFVVDFGIAVAVIAAAVVLMVPLLLRVEHQHIAPAVQ